MHKIENFTPSNGVAVVAGPRVSFLDHLMPLCHFWQIPLICTDPWVLMCAQTYYPPTEIFLTDHTNFQKRLSDFQTIVSVEPCRLHAKALKFGDFLFQKEVHTIVGFHGNPCKFREEFWIERYAYEDAVLIYGQYLIDYFKEKGVWQHLKNPVVLGNLRKKYYEKHQLFFDRVVAPFLFPKNGKKTVLVAPTWQYPEWVFSFSSLLEKIPSNYQILLKLHPFCFRLYPEKIAALKETYASHSNILFIDEIPLIYPLLAQTDIYLGDYSSVAYDFLSFNRPLFLLSKESYEWAVQIKNLESAFSTFEQEDRLEEIRKRTYQYIFEIS